MQFALINEIDQREAKRIVEMYHLIYPGIRGSFYEMVKRQLQKDRTLTNCFGRKVRFMDAMGPDLYKAAYSMLPQSTVVDSLNGGLVKTYNNDWITSKQGCNIDILAQVHDSGLMQIPVEVIKDGRFAKVQELVYDYVSPELSYGGRTFKIRTDAKIGKNWGGYNKETNPLGMRKCKGQSDALAFVDSLEA